MMLRTMMVTVLAWGLLSVPASTERRILTQDQLVDRAAVLDQYNRASDADRVVANKSLAYARRAALQNRWGAAFKSYGEASLVAPSADSLLGLSLSIARVARPRDRCLEELKAKRRDLSLATEYLGVASALLRHMKSTSLDEWGNIGSTFSAVLDVHRRLLERQERCQP